MSTIAELLVKLGLDKSGFESGIAEATSSSGGLKGAIGGITGTLATVGLAAGGITAIAGGVGIVKDAVLGVIAPFNTWADIVDSVGDALGTTSEEGSGLAVLAQGMGVDVGSLTKQLVFMAKGLEDGSGGLGKTGKLLKDMGVSVFDVNGKMRSSTQIFGDVSTKLAGMPDGLQKTALMMQIFGKTGSEMSDILNAAANGGVQNAIDKSKALGLSMSEEGVNGSIEFAKAQKDLQMTLQGLMVSIGSELMPVITPMIKDFARWAIEVMPVVLQAIKDVGAFIKDPFIPTIQGIWDTFKGVLDFLDKAFTPVFDNIKMIFKLFSLAFAGDWEGFGRQLRLIWDTAWRQIGELVQKAWNNIKNINWGEVARSIGQGLVNGIISINDWVIGAIINLGRNILNAIRGFLGISSPSKVFHDRVGVEIGRGILSGISDSMSGADFSVFAPSRITSIQPISVNLEYRPTISFADEREAKERLLPIIVEGVRSENARTK